MEWARAESAAAELAARLRALTPEERPLVGPQAPDPELDQALAGTGARLETVADPTLFWRVLDRPSLARLARLPAADDEELLAALVGGSRALYWPSDRF